MPSVNSGNVMQSYALFNNIVKQVTGRDDLAAHDASTFLGCAHQIETVGKDVFSGKLTQTIAETYFYQPKYDVDFEDILVNVGEFGALRREISFGDIETKSDPMYGVREGDTVGSWEVENLLDPIELGWEGFDVERLPLTIRLKEFKDALSSIEQFNKLASMRTQAVVKALREHKSATARAAVLGLIATLIADKANHPERVVDITDEYCKKYGYVDGQGVPNKTYADIVAMGDEVRFWQEYARIQDVVFARLASNNVLYKNIYNGVTMSESVTKDTLKGYMLADYAAAIQDVVRPTFLDNSQFSIKDLKQIAHWQAFEKVVGSDKVSASDAIYFKGVTPNESNGKAVPMENAVSETGIISVLFQERACFAQIYADYTLPTPWDADRGVQKTVTHINKLPVINPYHKAVVFKLH